MTDQEVQAAFPQETHLDIKEEQPKDIAGGSGAIGKCLECWGDIETGLNAAGLKMTNPLTDTPQQIINAHLSDTGSSHVTSPKASPRPVPSPSASPKSRGQTR